MNNFPKPAKKKTVLLQVRIDKTLHESLKAICEDNGLTMKSAVVFGLNHFIEESKKIKKIRK